MDFKKSVESIRQKSAFMNCVIFFLTRDMQFSILQFKAYSGDGKLKKLAVENRVYILFPDRKVKMADVSLSTSK